MEKAPSVDDANSVGRALELTRSLYRDAVELFLVAEGLGGRPDKVALSAVEADARLERLWVNVRRARAEGRPELQDDSAVLEMLVRISGELLTQVVRSAVVLGVDLRLDISDS